MNDIYQFLEQLSLNPAQQRMFTIDPVAVMSAAGLDEHAQALLQRRQPEALEQALHAGSWDRSAMLSDPSYDPPPPDYDNHSEAGR